MTKKVLISLEDYIELQEEAMKYEHPDLRLMKFRELFLEWFGAQPDAPQWRNCSHNDIPVDSQAVVVFNGESQKTGLSWMNDGLVWQDINGELGENDLIDFWIEMPETTGDENDRKD